MRWIARSMSPRLDQPQRLPPPTIRARSESPLTAKSKVPPIPLHGGFKGYSEVAQDRHSDESCEDWFRKAELAPRKRNSPPSLRWSRKKTRAWKFQRFCCTSLGVLPPAACHRCTDIRYHDIVSESSSAWSRWALLKLTPLPTRFGCVSGMSLIGL